MAKAEARLKLILMVNVKGVHEQQPASQHSFVRCFPIQFHIRGDVSRRSGTQKHCMFTFLLCSHKRNLRWKLPTSHLSCLSQPPEKRNLIATTTLRVPIHFSHDDFWNEEFLTRMSRARDYNKYHYSLPSSHSPSLSHSPRIRLALQFRENLHNRKKVCSVITFLLAFMKSEILLQEHLKREKLRTPKQSTPWMNKRKILCSVVRDEK